jgi:hypothetical protein
MAWCWGNWFDRGTSGSATFGLSVLDLNGLVLGKTGSIETFVAGDWGLEFF